jgi:hypothetical protein
MLISTKGTSWQGAAWLVLAAIIGTSLAFLFKDSCQQDGGYHFLFARWAWTHTELFVGVWARPLFTTLYALPALHSYLAAKLFTAMISVLIGWQTWQLAEDLALERAPLVIPFLYLQPSFFIICADTMTEPIFALVFVIALRLHLRGWRKSGMIVASLMILARPEGFFLVILWGVWVLLDRRDDRSWFQRIPETSLLTLGSILWWLSAWAITGDPLFIKNNWPSNWPVSGTIYGTGAWWNYIARSPEIIGPLLIPPFLIGLRRMRKSQGLFETASVFILFFVLHTILRAYGLLGSAGYPRYFVAISPVIAVLTLSGWNEVSSRFSTWTRACKTVFVTVLFTVSLILCFAYFDGAEWIRDAKAVDEMHRLFNENPQPIERFIWSEAYMCIRFAQDPWENLSFSGDRERDLASLQASPRGTLVLWETIYGPKWHGLRSEDFAAAGYRLLKREDFILRGYILPRSFFGFGGPRHQEMSLYYK